MPITAGCPQCGKTYRVKDDFGGKKFRCKACQGVVSVPEPQEPSGDPWDDLDIDSFQDQGAADSHEAEYEFETPPAPRRKARTKKSRRRRSRSTDGMPVGVMIAVGCECVLILGNLAGIVLNIVQQTPSGACAPVFRILIELSIVLGLLNRQNVARWASIALSIRGLSSAWHVAPSWRLAARTCHQRCSGSFHRK